MLNNKTCSKCNITKAIKLFHNNSSKKDGRNNWCKKCMKPALKKKKTLDIQKKKALTKELWTNLLNEEWVILEGYEGRYEISNKSRIRSVHFNAWKLRSTPVNSISGYKYITLEDSNKKSKTHYLHRLVAKTFILNPNNYSIVNHIDGDKANASIDNLEWCSQLSNTRHSICILGKHKLLNTRNCGGHYKKETNKIYEQARKLTKDTGIKYHVDHIVPLNSTLISGLHVPWNLRIIESNENFSKNNKLY